MPNRGRRERLIEGRHGRAVADGGIQDAAVGELQPSCYSQLGKSERLVPNVRGDLNPHFMAEEAPADNISAIRQLLTR